MEPLAAAAEMRFKIGEIEMLVCSLGERWCVQFASGKI